MNSRDTSHWAERLSSPSMEGRGEATHALAALGISALPFTIEILSGKNRWGHPYDHSSRRGAIIALRIMGPVAAPAVPTLIQALHAPDVTIRWEAAAALGAIGPAAREALPALEQASEDPHPDVRIEAKAAIKRIERSPG